MSSSDYENNKNRSTGDTGSNPLGLELSQEELDGLFKSCAEQLVKSGEISDNKGVFAKEEGQTPKIFTYSLPKELVRKVYHPGDDSLVIGPDSSIQYADPHRVDDAPGEEWVSSIILVEIKAQLANNPEVTLTEEYMLLIDEFRGNSIRATVQSEYASDEGRLSPNDIPLRQGRPLTDEIVGQLLDDMPERPFTLTDAEKLRKVIDYIQNPATLDNL